MDDTNEINDPGEDGTLEEGLEELSDGELLEENTADSEELFEMERELAASSKKEMKSIEKRKRKARERFLDDGDDKIFEKRIRRHLAEEELKRIDDDREAAFKELGHNFILNRSVWDTLYPFQKEGVRWLTKLHRERVGGILADEMGLGKTVQTLAFLRALSDTYTGTPASSRYNGLGAVLIVCPASIIVQWAKYCHKYLPMARTLIFHTSGSYKGKLKNLARRLLPKKDGLFVIVPYTTFMAYCEGLSSCEWRYMVLDEAHIIKNPELKLTQSLKAIRTPHRLLLTGTPLQNNLKELWSLLDCAYPGRLGSLEPFLNDIAHPITRGGYANSTPLMKETAARCAHVLRNAIRPYLLRRTKVGVEAELNLPKKQEQVLFCDLTQEQRKLYVEFLESRACARMIEARHTFLPFSGITILRKLCNHPHLISGNFDGTKSYTEDDTKKSFGHPSLSGKLEVTRRLLALWKKQGNSKVLLFSQSRVMLDVIEAMLLRDGHTYLRMDGSTPISIRDNIVSNFSNDSSIFVFILTTRVGGLGLNLTSANKVLIFDPCWNPSTDSQARERAWRIGQIRDVTIYRLVTFGTIEEKIYHRQLFKEFLAQRVLSKKAQYKLELSTTDLKDLFTLTDRNEGKIEKKQLKKDKHTKYSDDSKKFDKLLELDNDNSLKETALNDGEDETEESFPCLSNLQREELRQAANREDIAELVPSKCKRDERPADSGELFDGKYQIPYLVKHTKTRRDRKLEEEEKASKTEDGVMTFLLKRGVREALNHDAVLGYSDRKKVEAREKRALGIIGEKKKKIKKDNKEDSEESSKLEAPVRNFLGGSRKRPSDQEDREDGLLAAIRRRKEKENNEVKAFI